jgi:hypothetical protein
MRLYGPGSISTPARVVLDAFLVIAGLLIAAEVLVVIVLLVNPLHPIRQHFQTTTIAAVPVELWPPEEVVRIAPGIAIARVEPWAYIRYQPASRWFVAATAAVSFSWWACALLILLYLRRAFKNLSGGTPFPRDNIRCIRRTGFAFLGMAAVELITDAVGLGFIHATTTVAGKSAVIPLEVWLIDFPLVTIMAGMAVVILAEVFRAGADLQDDQALTV